MPDESGPMKYWGGGNSLDLSCRSVHGLLQFSDANCGEWAELLKTVFSAQGIDGVQRVFLLPPEPAFPMSLVPVGSVQTPQEKAFLDMRQLLPAATIFLVPPMTGGYDPDQAFLVKKWDIPTSGTPVCYLSDRFNRSTFSSPSNYNFDVPLQNGNQLKYYEENGEGAQGIANPVSEFRNHAVVFYEDEYYDPSYGIGPLDSNQAYESKAIYGRSVIVRALIPIITPMGPMTKPIFVLYHLDHEQSNVVDLQFIPE